MRPPVPQVRSWRDLQGLTPARVGRGRTGASLPTSALLTFTLDHARARDAVHAPFDAAAIVQGIEALDLPVLEVASEATDREIYLRRPDLGRQLDALSRDLLTSRQSAGYDLAIVIGDGLSSSAVHAEAVKLVGDLLPRLRAGSIGIGPVVVARGARVALGDEIGLLLGARMVVMLIGERPGLSAPASLGAYLTFDPRPGRSDAARNCVSNIHGAGLNCAEAAFKIDWLIRQGLSRRLTGVTLKDESGEPGKQAIPAI